MKYITPSALRAAGTGLPLTNFSDADLAGMIARAESRIDAYVGFREDQQGFSFGTRTERAPFDYATRRVYFQSFPTPVRSISSFVIQVSQQTGTGAPINATVDPTNVIINNDEGYLEVTSITVLIYGLTPVLISLMVSQPFAVVTYSAGYQIVKTALPLVGYNDYLSYTSNIPYWDTTATPVVFRNGIVVLSNLYTVDSLNGTITFNTRSATAATDQITCTFTHTIPDLVTQVTRAVLEEVGEEAIARSQGASGYSSFKSGVRSATRRMRLPGVKPEWQEDLDNILTGVVMST